MASCAFVFLDDFLSWRAVAFLKLSSATAWARFISSNSSHNASRPPIISLLSVDRSRVFCFGEQPIKGCCIERGEAICRLLHSFSGWIYVAREGCHLRMAGDLHNFKR